jgi:hypothetical protein
MMPCILVAEQYVRLLMGKAEGVGCADSVGDEQEAKDEAPGSEKDREGQ